MDVSSQPPIHERQCARWDNCMEFGVDSGRWCMSGIQMPRVANDQTTGVWLMSRNRYNIDYDRRSKRYEKGKENAV